MPNVIELLTKDHRIVEELFARFNMTGEGALASAICRELAAHAEAEEHIVYAALAELRGDASALLEEQSSLKGLCARAMQSEGDGLLALMSVIEELLLEHVTQEESTDFPMLADALPPHELDVLGARYLQVKLRLA